MVQLPKLPLAKAAACIGTPVQVPALSLPILHHADALGKAKEDGSSTWAFATHMGDPNGIPGSSFSLAHPGLSQPSVEKDGTHTHSVFLSNK